MINVKCSKQEFKTFQKFLKFKNSKITWVGDDLVSEWSPWLKIPIEHDRPKDEDSIFLQFRFQESTLIILWDNVKIPDNTMTMSMSDFIKLIEKIIGDEQ